MKKIILSALLVIFGVSAQAVEVDLVKKVESRLMSAFGPMLQVKTVEPLANQQLLEVVLIDGSVVHMTPDTNYFLYNDSLYHLTKTGAENVTESRLNPKRAAALKAVKNEQTVFFAAKGQQKAVIDVFTDIDCSFCQKLHQEVPRLNELGVSVRYFAYPRSGIENPQNGQKTDSYNKINYVWCAKEPTKAMTKIKADQHDIITLSQRLRQGGNTDLERQYRKLTQDMGNMIANTKNCNSPVAEQFELGQELGVTGTPAIFTEKGELIPGYMPADELVRRLGI